MPELTVLDGDALGSARRAGSVDDVGELLRQHCNSRVLRTLLRDLSRIRRWAQTGAYDAPIDLVAATQADEADGSAPVVRSIVSKLDASA